MRMCVCYLDCHGAVLCCYLVTHRKSITSIAAVLSPSVTYLLTLPRTFQAVMTFRRNLMPPHLGSKRKQSARCLHTSLTLRPRGWRQNVSKLPHYTASQFRRVNPDREYRSRGTGSDNNGYEKRGVPVSITRCCELPTKGVPTIWVLGGKLTYPRRKKSLLCQVTF
jgi:hypothetical protein